MRGTNSKGDEETGNGKRRTDNHDQKIKIRTRDTFKKGKREDA